MASAGSLMCGVRVQQTPGLLHANWYVKPGPEVSAELLADRAGSWSLDVGPRDPRAGVRLLVAKLVPDIVGYVFWVAMKLALAC